MAVKGLRWATMIVILPPVAELVPTGQTADSLRGGNQLCSYDVPFHVIHDHHCMIQSYYLQWLNWFPQDKPLTAQGEITSYMVNKTGKVLTVTWHDGQQSKLVQYFVGTALCK